MPARPVILISIGIPPTNTNSYLKKIPSSVPAFRKNAYLYPLNCLIRAFDEGWLPLAVRTFSDSDKTKSTIYQWITHGTTTPRRLNKPLWPPPWLHEQAYIRHWVSCLVEGKEGKGKNNTLFKDACEYKPIRDALVHTSWLTRVAKNKGKQFLFDNNWGTIGNTNYRWAWARLQ